MVAGCSGGSVNSSGNFVPPGGANAARAMTKAQISLTFSTAGTSSASRQTASLNSTVQQVGIRFIPVPAPAVTPTETVFTIPQPAPASTTLVVDAPVGQDTFILGAYEPPPVCPPPTSIVRQAGAVRNAKAQAPLPSLVPLNGSVQAVNLSANGANALSINLGPVTFGGSISIPTQTGIGAGYLGSLQWAPLENLSTNQSIGMAVQPLNVCGQPMSGTVANSVVLNGPGGVAFSPSALNAAGNTTATYAGGTNASGTITGSGSLPANTTPSATSVALTPDYFIFALDSTGSYFNVVDGQSGISLDGASGVTLGHSRTPLRTARQTQAGTRSTQSFVGSVALAMAAVNASPCTSGAQAAAVAVVGAFSQGNGIDIFTVTPTGSVSAPTFIPWTAFGSFNLNTPDAVAFDASCRLYVGDNWGYLGVGSASGINSVANENGFSGAGVTALLAGPSSMFAGYQISNNWQVGTFPFGGTSITPSSFMSSTSSTISIDGLALAGGSVFVASTTSSCFADFSALGGGTPVDQPVGCCPATLQFYGTATGSTLFAYTRSGYMLTIAGGSATTTFAAPSSGGSINGIAVTQDSPTSTLWISGAGGSQIFQMSLPGLTWTGRAPSVSFMSGAPPGPLSIAP
jgi:hypothetical protein